MTTNLKYPLWQQRSRSINKLVNWRAEGRLAVSFQGKGNNANFIWEQIGEDFTIKLMGPFGAGAILLKGSASQTLFQDNTGKQKVGRSPEELMQELMGWHIPISGLQYWVRGLTSPRTGIDHLTITKTDGTLLFLQQSNWHIAYQRYITDLDILLPAKIHLTNNKLEIKLLIKKWSRL